VFGTQRDLFQVWLFWRKDVTGTKTATTTCKMEDGSQLSAESFETLHFPSGLLPPGGIAGNTATVATYSDTSPELHSPTHPHLHAPLGFVSTPSTSNHYTSRSMHILFSSTQTEV
jgi:hypothetical protein